MKVGDNLTVLEVNDTEAVLVDDAGCKFRLKLLAVASVETIKTKYVQTITVIDPDSGGASVSDFLPRRGLWWPGWRVWRWGWWFRWWRWIWRRWSWREITQFPGFPNAPFEWIVPAGSNREPAMSI